MLNTLYIHKRYLIREAENMTDEKRRFTVINNDNLTQEKDYYKKERTKSYQTNPLKEQFMRFTNEEAGRRFSVEDLLKW